MSSLFITLSALYLALNLVAFIIFAPLKTTIAGWRLSFTTLDNPLKISLLLFLVGLFFKHREEKPPGLSQRSLLAAVFCLVFLIYLSSGVMTSFDSRWTLPTARSMVTEGNTDLDEYQDFHLSDDYRVEQIDGHYYSIFPVGVPVIALPFIWIFNDEVVRNSYPDIERLLASLFMAITSILIFLISSTYLKNRKLSLLVVFVFAFCTSAWSTGSRALWQQGPSMLMLTTALYLVMKARVRPGVIQYVSLPLVFALIIRPTNILSLVFLTIFVFFQHKKYFLRYLLWASFLLVPFFLYNLSVYHALLSPYYLPQRIGSLSQFLPALGGNLISPSRGLLIFSPVFVFSIFGFLRKAKMKELGSLDLSLLTIIVFHWLSISSFAHWWAGHSYGPRFFADMIPYFIFLMIPAVKALAEFKGMKKWALMAVFALLMTASFLIHLRGATTQAVYEWNNYPVDVDRAPERVWDWHDIQFLRGL